RPADAAARPVAAIGGVAAGERLQRDRRRALPLAVAVAVVGDARLRAAAGAGEDEDAFVAGQPVAQGLAGTGRIRRPGDCGHAEMLTGAASRCSVDPSLRAGVFFPGVVPVAVKPARPCNLPGVAAPWGPKKGSSPDCGDCEHG